ncbi:MAG: adenylosuccinate lyase [Candidatus Latescibacterota bacterium]|nr:MAG: adenylosuccinate lyase [Candidatus Latescibacterota bacterium]
MERSRYENPLISRYASREMSYIFSPEHKFRLWRRLWITLAEAQRELGLPISEEQIEELKAHRDEVNYEVAEAREREVRHDVMAHIYAYGLQCPKAKGIIHLGATSAYVGDNADLIILREALELVLKRLVNVIAALKDFALRYKDLPTLSFTHFQPAQPTTVGKRACLWLQDFLMDVEEVEHRLRTIRFRGAKGTTGTQASFLALFGGDSEKVRELDRRVAEKMGFSREFLVTGQTYPRKLDTYILGALVGIAQSAHKFSNDIRLLQHLKEVEEPFEAAQVGSSAMPYKRNPMRSERTAALSRYIISLYQNPAFTASSQWLERTLDDSANRRLVLPEAFLATDAVLLLCRNVAGGLVVHPRMIEKHLREELPFMAAEEILMEAVRRGGDRQELHERLRKYAHEAGRRVKEGQANDFLDRVASDPAFGLTREDLELLMDPTRFVRRASQQVEEFMREEVEPVLKRYRSLLGEDEGIRV